MAISTVIKTIQDIMRKDAGVDGDAQRISQLVWMIFLKIFEDKEKEYEQLEENYRSPIPEKLRWRNCAGVTGLLMRQVINKIYEIDFNISEDRHLFGDIYEQILRDLQSAGNAGEYYTPRAITQFMVDMVDPKLGEKILDPACGTGGFLTCAINNIRRDYVKSIEDEEKLQKSISGVEKKPLPHLLCVTNMLLHGIEVPSQIRHDNTLARPLRDYGSADRVDVIVTNPPFGGMEEDGIESNFPASYRTRETADLFLLLIMHLLKEGGRGAIVLPDGTLFGEGVKTRI
jgi:type I restriction enzyme M protein